MGAIDLNNIVEAPIAIVLTDIIGSTKFVQRNGSHIAAVWFGKHDRMVMNFIARHGGQLVDASDGHLIYFATVEDAICFAFDYKEKLKLFPFKSRVGIHWDNMLIVRSEEHIVRAGGKRINLEGIGKNIAARTMSLCGPDQILLSNEAYKKFKTRIYRASKIRKDVLVACVGLYKFKGVKDPEVLYSLGTEEAHLQPPENSEKAKRLGGKKKIKTRLRDKKAIEIYQWLSFRLGLVSAGFWIVFFFNAFSDSSFKKSFNIDYPFLKPFEWILEILLLLKDLYLELVGNLL